MGEHGTRNLGNCGRCEGDEKKIVYDRFSRFNENIWFPMIVNKRFVFLRCVQLWAQREPVLSTASTRSEMCARNLICGCTSTALTLAARSFVPNSGRG